MIVKRVLILAAVLVVCFVAVPGPAPACTAR
ncbi:hypothetical protein J2S43_000817 [Catenuloplanes nepalensis]|uniref:Uncharacterized protein n=1 Tax=Catenuloplanes nepalensis TaxID=587533 RepID=A0ABT9MLL1_9ACTN|nr:hypothetical protein [Catenuloplanes nepalensis]